MIPEEEARLHKLAALSLFCCQGMLMIAQGQEYGRSKVIAPTDAPDTRSGYIDHNSYEKDDETNWLNYDHEGMNHELTAFYAGLIRLRKTFQGLGGAPVELVMPIATGQEPAVAALIRCSELGDPGDLFYCLNPASEPVIIELPIGRWRPLVLDGIVHDTGTGKMMQGVVEIAPTSGVLLLREDLSDENP
jgi:hypothetical protein